MMFRTAAAIIYGVLMSQTSRTLFKDFLFGLSVGVAASLIFPFLTILLDLYHYRIWWAYVPDVDVESTLLKQPFSSKHRRCIPYVLVESFRNEKKIGNRKCKKGENCEGED